MQLFAQLISAILLIAFLTKTCKSSIVLSANYFDEIDQICQQNYTDYTIRTNCSNETIAQQQAYDRCVTHKCIETLSNAWSENSLLEQHAVKDLHNKLLKKHSSTYIFNIFAKTIDEIYNTQSTDLLFKQLQQIYQPDSVETLQIMLETQMYLFWKHTNRHDSNDRYLLLVAYYLQELQSNQLIEQLKQSLRARMNAMKNGLPSTLYNFFFKPDFCLLNKASRYYLYTTLASGYNDGHFKYVFIWEYNSAVGTSGKFEIGQSDENEFLLLGKDLGLPLYIDKERSKLANLVGAWRNTGDAVPNALWSVNLTSNTLVFSQLGRKMCASRMSHDNYRRYVQAITAEIDDEGCQWYAVQC